jgi:hypothetical protein
MSHHSGIRVRGGAWTLAKQLAVAPLVHSGLAHHTSVALLAEPPQELLAECAERRLPEELRHEPVPVHLVDSEMSTTRFVYFMKN